MPAAWQPQQIKSDTACPFSLSYTDARPVSGEMVHVSAQTSKVMQATQELNVLLRLKQSVMSDSTCQLEPEDQLYLMSRAKVSHAAAQVHIALLSQQSDNADELTVITRHVQPERPWHLSR